MADSSASVVNAVRPRGWRFSLRTLLLLITLASVGLWYWYRIPYSLEVQVPHSYEEIDPSASVNTGIFTGTNRFLAKEVQEFRRVLRGAPIRHGLTKLYYPDGQQMGEENYLEGSLHGRWLRLFPSGEVSQSGEYVRGQRHGVWERFDIQRNLRSQINFDHGVPHGEAKWWNEGTLTRVVRCDRGEVMEIGGRRIDDPLGRAYRLGTIDSRLVADALCTSITWNVVYTCVEDLANCEQKLGVSVVLDRHCDWRANAPVTFRAFNMTGGMVWPIAFDEIWRGTERSGIAVPNDLVATYRHGCIWITTKENAQGWVDRTGVSDLLKLPPAGISQRQVDELKQSLDRPLSMSFVRMSAADTANHLRTSEQLPIDWIGTTNGPAISIGFRDLPLRHILGAICEQHDLRVRWGEGAALVLEPQDRGTR